tara:strand:+ start:124 stop:333 length:210 start_codon:yes stop_codon:yes gene_type:complete
VEEAEVLHHQELLQEMGEVEGLEEEVLKMVLVVREILLVLHHHKVIMVVQEQVMVDQVIQLLAVEVLEQ